MKQGKGKLSNDQIRLLELIDRSRTPEEQEELKQLIENEQKKSEVER